MTLLPWPSWQVKARLDLPAYELNKVCPVSGLTWGLEDHHIWRRSFGAEYREAWWVELEDGRVVPNRVALHRDVHRGVTENRYAIRLVDTEGGLKFYFYDGGNVFPIEVAVGIASDLHTPADTEEPGGDADCDHEDVETCSACKGTGKRKRRNKRANTGRVSRKRVISTRIPATEPGGYETLKTLHDAAEAILVESGLLQERGNGAAFYREIPVYQFFVTQHRELLPDDWKGENFEIDDSEDE